MSHGADNFNFWLPPQFTVLRRLIRVLGISDALLLLRSYGGRPLKLPMQPRGVLLEMLGAEKLCALLAEFEPGTVLTLPMPNKIDARLRNAAIRAEKARGDSLAVLAARHRLTTRHICNIIGAPPPPLPPQRDLFGDGA